jgi:O-antigen/teichoic acid export membrane protein
VAFGINFVLVKSSQFQQNPKAFFTRYIILFDIVSAVVFPVFFAISYFQLSELKENIFLIILIFGSGFCTAYDALLGGYLLGIGKATLSTALTSFIPKLALFVTLLLFYYVFGKQFLMDYYVIGYLVVYFLSCVPYSFVFFRKAKFRFSKTEIVAILSFFVLVVTQSLNTNLSKVIQGQYDSYQSSQGKSYTGILGLSMQIMTLATLFSATVTTLAQPVFAFHSERKDNTSLIDEYRTVLRVNSYITIPFCIALMIEAKSLLSIFGSSYSDSKSVIFFLIIAASFLLSSVTGPDGTLLTFSGHEKIQIINGLIYIIVFVGFSIFLETFTIFGIAIAFAISTIVVEGMKLIEIGVYYKTIPIDIKTLFTLLVMSGICIAIFYPITFVQNAILWTAANILIGIMAIILCFFLSPFRKDKYFFKTKSLEQKNISSRK